MADLDDEKMMDIDLDEEIEENDAWYAHFLSCQRRAACPRPPLIFDP